MLGINYISISIKGTATTADDPVSLLGYYHFGSGQIYGIGGAGNILLFSIYVRYFAVLSLRFSSFFVDVTIILFT